YHLTEGVARVGDTVRRPWSSSSEFTSRLRQHLENEGFDGVPRWLGRDEKGRETLGYIPGETKWRPLADAQVAAGAYLLRQFHDATRGSELAGNAEVICHGDAGPNNAIFQ